MLLEDIIAHPGDDGPRLAFADRLEETGADDARAEFIRVGCASPGVTPGPARVALYRRERQLLWLLRPALLAELPPALPDYHAWGLCLARHADDITDPFTLGFARGFAGIAALPCDAWHRHGPVLVRAVPLTRVRLTDRTPNPVDGEYRRYYWWHRDLPIDVYRLMACDDAQPVAPGERPNWKRYPGLAAAESAASDALLAWARAVATTALSPLN